MSLARLLASLGFTLAVAGCGVVPAADTFETHLPERLQPALDPARAVAVARAYLDAQREQLAAPELHEDPDVAAVTLARASDAARIEPQVPPRVVQAAAPDRLVWIVQFARGDFLNLAPLPWSSGGDPAPCGTIIVEDGSATLLGVYPSTTYCGPSPGPS